MTKDELIDKLAREIGEAQGCRYWKENYPAAVKELAERSCVDLARAFVTCTLWVGQNRPYIDNLPERERE